MLNVPTTTIMTISTPPNIIPLASLGSFVLSPGVGDGATVSWGRGVWLESAAGCATVGCVPWLCTELFSMIKATNSKKSAMIIVTHLRCIGRGFENNRIGNLFLKVLASATMPQRLFGRLLLGIFAS